MNKPSEYITDLFHKLREDISWIKQKLFVEKPKLEPADTPKQYIVNAVHTDDNSKHESGDPKTIVRATLNMPKAVRVEAETHERHKKWYRDRVFILEMFGVLAAIFYAFIAWNQWQDSAENFRTDERAWLSVTTIKGVTLPSPEEVTLKGWAPINYSYVVENVGKTIATNARARSAYSFGTEPKQQFTDYSSESTASYQILFPHLPIESYATRNPAIVHRDEDMQWIAGKIHLYIYLMVEYDTIFKPSVRHHTYVCAVWVTPSQQLFCHTGNKAD